MRPIQKQYQRKIRLNHKNQAFTTFHPKPPHSNQQYTEHQRIQSLKNTLRTITPHLSAQLSRHKSTILADSVQQEHYHHKLDRLTQDLQQIAHKHHFHQAGTAQAKKRTGSQVSQKYPPQHKGTKPLADLSRPLKASNFGRQSEGKQSALSKSHSFSSHLHVQRPHNKSMQGLQRSSHKRAHQGGSSSKKGSDLKGLSQQQMVSKRALFEQNLPGNARNLNHLWEKEDEDEGWCGGMVVLMHKRVHQSGVSSLLVGDALYSGGRDGNVAKMGQREGIFGGEMAMKARGAVTHLASINGKPFVGSEDSYLRSVDGVFFYRCDSIPQCFYDADRGQTSIKFLNNSVALFDLHKRVKVSNFHLNSPFQLFTNHHKQTFLAQGDTVSSLDWRHPHTSELLPSALPPQPTRWFADPFGGRFCRLKGAELAEMEIGTNRKVMGRRLENGWEAECWDWSRHGLHIYFRSGEGSAGLIRFGRGLQPQTVDGQGCGDGVRCLVMREKQVCYGLANGEIVIKKIRK